MFTPPLYSRITVTIHITLFISTLYKERDILIKNKDLCLQTIDKLYPYHDG